MSAEWPAAVALQRAVRERRIKISDAKHALTQPTEVQDRALELVSSGTARSLASAIRRLNEEGRKEADDAVLAVDQATPLDEAITLHQVGLGDLHALVSPASVDAIITHPPHGPESLPLLPDLAAFAATRCDPRAYWWLSVELTGCQTPWRDLSMKASSGCPSSTIGTTPREIGPVRRTEFRCRASHFWSTVSQAFGCPLETTSLKCPFPWKAHRNFGHGSGTTLAWS
ncbi:MAG: hypothetical protein OXE17_01275 [Chloroflexi bacterium]|nr:hypothetical protein [Chloroflexota bacterium]